MPTRHTCSSSTSGGGCCSYCTAAAAGAGTPSKVGPLAVVEEPGMATVRVSLGRLLLGSGSPTPGAGRTNLDGVPPESTACGRPVAVDTLAAVRSKRA